MLPNFPRGLSLKNFSGPMLKLCLLILALNDRMTQRLKFKKEFGVCKSSEMSTCWVGSDAADHDGQHI